MKTSFLLSAAILLFSTFTAANAESIATSMDRFGLFLLACSSSFTPEEKDMSAADQLTMSAMMEDAIDAVVDDIERHLTEQNADPATVTACIDSFESMGCVGLESGNPPAGCEIVDEAMN